MGGDGPQYEYVRVADEIEARVRRGQWKFGAKLPGRGRLAELLGESEMTVRRALRELEERGMVRVLPSSGAWVTWDGHEPGTRESLEAIRYHFKPSVNFPGRTA